MKNLLLTLSILGLASCCPEEITPEPPTENSVLFDGHYYEYVEINGVYWFAENLQTTTFADGTPIPFIPDGDEWASNTFNLPAYTYFDLLEENQQERGNLYNGGAVIDNRNICPTGWHVSTDDDWKNLELFVGATEEDYIEPGFIYNVSTDLKSSSTDIPPWDGSNFTGFSAIPGGYIETDGDFHNETYSYWFTSTPFDNSHLWGRGMGTGNDWIHRPYYPMTQGLFVRCVKD